MSNNPDEYVTQTKQLIELLEKRIISDDAEIDALIPPLPTDEWMAIAGQQAAEIQRLRSELAHITARHDELATMNAEIGFQAERMRLAGAVEMVTAGDIACLCGGRNCHRTLHVTDDILQIEDEDSGRLLEIVLPPDVRLYREVTP